jgi:acyl-CoA synthetase (AMP-forming)/AMP-acid ligase II
MTFLEIERNGAASAAIDARSGKTWTYAQLHEDVARFRATVPQLGRKSLGLLIAQNRYECLVAYLAALSAESALILLDAALNPELLRQLLELYRPDWIFASQPGADFAGYRESASGEAGLFEIERPYALEIHPEVALLLSTSGSTGSPKFVRLTLRNLQANADSIVQYLQLTPRERPITSLPMAYSYGLSVINSHLHAGATIIFTEDGVLRREFWDAVERYGCTSFAGVPYTYEVLFQTGLLKKWGTSLRVLTQAGGRLDERYIRELWSLALSRGWKFFVMYGQTEAAPRISYVPFDQLGRKIGSIGIAVPHGSLTLDESTGELVYCGPNVMLGYAECPQDLAKGDELFGVLRTGDLAWQDADGYFYISGRLKRFLKLFGRRFNLDELEIILSRRFESTVACCGRDDLLIAGVENREDTEMIRGTVCEMFDLPRAAVKVVAMKELPRTPSGKLEYQRVADGEQARGLQDGVKATAALAAHQIKDTIRTSR